MQLHRSRSLHFHVLGELPRLVVKKNSAHLGSVHNCHHHRDSRQQTAAAAVLSSRSTINQRCSVRNISIIAGRRKSRSHFMRTKRFDAAVRNNRGNKNPIHDDNVDYDEDF